MNQALFDSVPQSLPDKIVKPMLALAQTGVAKEVLSAMLDFGGIALRADHRHFLTGPIVQHRNGWQSTTPEWLYQAVPAERLAIVLDDHANDRDGWQVGPAEIATVLYPASLEGPLHHWAAEIYCWATGHAMAVKDSTSIDALRDKFGFVDDAEILTAAGRFHRHYHDLVTDIRRRVIRAARERQQSDKPARNVTTPRSAPDVESVQLDLL